MPDDLRKVCRAALERKIYKLLESGRLKKSWLLRAAGWYNVPVIVLPMWWYRILNPRDSCHGFVCYQYRDTLVLGVRNYKGYRKTVTYGDL